MSLILCVCDYQGQRSYRQIGGADNSRTACQSLRQIAAGDQHTFRRLRLRIDGIAAFYLQRELTDFTQLVQWIRNNPAWRGLQMVWLDIVPPPKEIIDYKWNSMVRYTLWERIEADHLMSWLSTLGGGYSALGEHFTRCAQTAGKISLKQLSIGLRLGDPFLQSRCKLFYSISLIQTGRLRQAKHIVRQQYAFAVPHKEFDGRLVKMCQGIWHRLQYEYGLRLKRRQLSRINGSGDA